MNLILGTCNQYALPVWSPNFDKNTPKLKFTQDNVYRLHVL